MIFVIYIYILDLYSLDIKETEWDVVHRVRPVQEGYNTSGEPLWTRQWTDGLHKMRIIS
jgi:hypothetical protein